MDIQFSAPNFTSTIVTAIAISPKGKEFFAEIYGPGAVSIDLKKSFGIAFITFAKNKGLTIR